jgi:hypothetical protein
VPIMQTRIERANTPRPLLKREEDMNYEVTNLKTGKSVGIYPTEAAARRYTGSTYQITKTTKPANAWPVGFNAL